MTLSCTIAPSRLVIVHCFCRANGGSTAAAAAAAAACVLDNDLSHAYPGCGRDARIATNYFASRSK